jgi:hypothetical protein
MMTVLTHHSVLPEFVSLIHALLHINVQEVMVVVLGHVIRMMSYARPMMTVMMVLYNALRVFVMDQVHVQVVGQIIKVSVILSLTNYSARKVHIL